LVWKWEKIVATTTTTTTTTTTPAKQWVCDRTKNFLRGIKYSQIDLTTAGCQSAAGCAGNPVYGATNDMDAANAYCQERCTQDCVGYFFQKHQNGKEICGFYKSDMHAAGVEWVWDGHKTGSRVCERNKAVAGVTKISTGQCIDGNANIGTASTAAKAAGIVVGGGGLSTVERCRDDCRRQQEGGVECVGFTFYKIWGGCVLWNQEAISNGCNFRPLTRDGKKKCWLNTPEECDTYTVARVPMTTTKPGTPKPMKTCYSVGDPHVQTFAGGLFDTHNVGWKPFYAKGNLVIELNQQTQIPDSGGATVNIAIRYSTDGGDNFVTRSEGELLGPNKDESEMQFSDPNVKLTVGSPDVSAGLPTARRMYNVYVKTNEYDDAKGQCVEDQLRRRLREEENSGGVPYPANPLVTKEEAVKACAALGSQMHNCVTDVRMANNPKATAVITQVFVEVENVLKRLEPTTTTTTTTESPLQDFETNLLDNGSVMTVSFCVGVAVLTHMFV